MIWLLALLWAADVGPAAAAADPRIEWVELQRSGQLELALSRVEEHLRRAPDTLPGAHYLRGRLLSALGRREEAATRLAAALGAEPDLEPWTRLRLAEAQVAQGHPEVAAGLLATLLQGRPPSELRQRAARLLAETLEQGGDCRLLARLDAWRLEAGERRPLDVARSACNRSADVAAANRELIAILAADTTDAAALEAAERLAVEVPKPPATVALDMAMAFFGQRDFERALDYFALALAPGALPAEARNDYATQYAIARSYFWLADYASAGERFAALAAVASRPEQRARAHYQQARSLELAGDRAAAATAYGRAHEVEPEGSWAAPGLSSKLRLSWLEGREQEALAIYQHLGSRRRWQETRARAALFLASSDLASERTDRAAAWLDAAAATADRHEPEVAYWQGRHAEASGEPARAIDHYRRALVADPWDPWAREGLSRLHGPALAQATASVVAKLATSGRERDLLAAWLLAPESEAGSGARLRLELRLTARSAERAFLELAPLPTAAWPLWKEPLPSAEDRLLAVGDWQFGAPVAARHFPSTEPQLALTRARALAEAGLARPSILAAEILTRSAPSGLPPSLWSMDLRRSLYPLAFGSLIGSHARARQVDPLLLAALIREESRFDAGATSAAAARGLTQFVLPTARRLGAAIGLGAVSASDLYRPETAVRLGAAYLAELGNHFGGMPHQMLAAYNAGEDQARLWRDYCLGEERAEYLTKVGFRETRGYLRKVLASHAHYGELYPDFGLATAVDTTPGSSPSTSSK